ncbi:hypothetical protein BDZ94DRAFT_1249505 [Collybia nuda]|uniref:Formamidase n=1 Tax=Collybia nuda TaxID=64659 RepID=A0A9P6CI81_9AGAR|nr:hypothetical protein BDZ94DRAFT_1249505 [Collybia nuda]
MSIHAVKRAHANLVWDNSIPPVIRIQSGETVTFDCLDASNGQVTPDSTHAHAGSMILTEIDQVNGPVYVEGALPGDTLQVDVLTIQIGEWGWTGVSPGFGLLHDEFPEPRLKLWKLDQALGFVYFDEAKRIKIPLRPFAGEMGVAPGKSGAFSTIPPYNTGGNLDTRHISAGATLFLPIEVEGALFSIGDGHAAQGDGEVCGTAIETSMKVSVRLTVRKDRSFTKTPHFISPPANDRNGSHYCTTGVEPDLREAARSAVRNMIEFLHATYKLERVDAYMLCSIVGDLRIHEAVDMPNYVVGMMIPHSVLPKEPV